MQVNHERRDAPESDAEHAPSKAHESARRRVIEKRGVEREEATAEKAGQRQAKEKKDTLEIALAPMAQNHHDPKKRQKSARCEHDESEVNKPTHRIGRSLSLHGEHGNGQVQEFSGIS